MFVHMEPLPDGMQPSEWQSFAEVTMEGLAPMPLEQLAWGYLIHERSTHLVLFAAARDRLERENLVPDGSFIHVLPSFFAAAPADSTSHWVLLWEAKHLVALHYESEIPLPTRFELEPLIEDTPAGAFAARDRLLKRLGHTGRTEAAPVILTQPEATRASRGRLQFTFNAYSAPDAEPTRVNGNPPADPAAYWTADLRDQAFRTAEQQRRRTLRIMNRALQAAGIAAAILLMLQFVWAGVSVWLHSAESRVTRQQPLVDQLTQKNDLVQKIDQFSAHQLRPFEMLGILNELRPPNVIFKSAKASNGDEIVAECTASDVPSVNSFIDAIDRSQVADVNPNSMNTLMGPRGVTFSLAVKFRQPPPAEAMPAEKPPEQPAANTTSTAAGFLGRPGGTLNLGTESPQPGENNGPIGPGGYDPNAPAQPEGPPTQQGPAVYLN
jgi:hypothetical protein